MTSCTEREWRDRGERLLYTTSQQIAGSSTATEVVPHLDAGGPLLTTAAPTAFIWVLEQAWERDYVLGSLVFFPSTHWGLRFGDESPGFLRHECWGRQGTQKIPICGRFQSSEKSHRNAQLERNKAESEWLRKLVLRAIDSWVQLGIEVCWEKASWEGCSRRIWKGGMCYFYICLLIWVRGYPECL